MDRRRFLKYAGATAAVVGASALGANYILRQGLSPVAPTTMTVAGQATATTSPLATSTQTVELASLHGRLFFDYNGNGIQDGKEPPIAGARVQLKKYKLDESGYGIFDSIAEAATDSAGYYTLNDVKAGDYRLFVEADKNFRHMCRSAKECAATGGGLSFPLDESKETNIGLMEGFLTLPFPRRTKQEYPPVYVDIDPVSGKWISWQGNDQTYDGHRGTDFHIHAGTKVLSAAPGRVIEIAPEATGGTGMRISHQFDGYSTLYTHLKETSVSVGRTVARGGTIGLSGFSVQCRHPDGSYFPCHADHLHFEIDRYGGYMDPYRSRVPNTGFAVSLWTKDNDPQYSS